jgi:hypothetical protein
MDGSAHAQSMNLHYTPVKENSMGYHAHIDRTCVVKNERPVKFFCVLSCAKVVNYEDFRTSRLTGNSIRGKMTI